MQRRLHPDQPGRDRFGLLRRHPGRAAEKHRNRPNIDRDDLVDGSRGLVVKLSNPGFNFLGF